MSIVWLIPAALWGLAALAVPVLVHLLTRQERRSIPFPSLRFLHATRLVALRHRRIHDWPLLLVRAAIIALAVAALAGPLLITPQRERAWHSRVARAMVVAAAEAGDATAASRDEIQSAFTSRVIPASSRIADALRSAVEWLSVQPPAARELVIAGDLRVGDLDDADLAAVPAHVGIRFLPEATATTETTVTMPVLTLAGDRAAVEARRVHVNATDTEVERGAAEAATPDVNARDLNARAPSALDMPAHRLEVRASAEDRPVADAALAALLGEGVIADAPEARHVIVEWPGATESTGGVLTRFPGEAWQPWMVAALERLDMDGTVVGDVLVVRLPARVDGAAAVSMLRRIAVAAFDDPALPREPRRIPAGDLARWSRAPGVATDAVRQEEGDRRVLWALVLALLALETVVRRTKARPQEAASPVEESRVA